MKAIRIIHTVLLAAIGAISVFMTSSVLLDLFDIRAKEGNYVEFVVVANLICGVLYLFAATMNWINTRLSVVALTLSVIVLLLAFWGLKNHITAGGLHEAKTVVAMKFRIIYSVAMLLIAIYLMNKVELKSKIK
jgi:hypothetical protein